LSQSPVVLTPPDRCTRIHGTRVPVEEPSTASEADIGKMVYFAAVAAFSINAAT
jgi:hypothetical protein